MATISTHTTHLNKLAHDLDTNHNPHFTLKSNLWKVAAAVSTVALVAIGTLAALTTILISSIILPHFLIPLAIISTVISVLLPTSLITAFVLTKCLKFSQENANKQRELSGLRSEHKKIVNFTSDQLRTHLTEKGINTDAPIEHLKPLVASHNHFESEINVHQSYKDRLLAKINELTHSKEWCILDNREELCADALLTDIKILKAKVRTAFARAALIRPDSRGTEEQTYQFTLTTHNDRLALASGADLDLVKFQRPNQLAITVNQAKTLSIAQLSERFLTAMTA